MVVLDINSRVGRAVEKVATVEVDGCKIGQAVSRVASLDGDC